LVKFEGERERIAKKSETAGEKKKWGVPDKGNVGACK